MESRRQACAGHSHGDRCESSDRRSFACIGRSVSVQQFCLFLFPSSFFRKKTKGNTCNLVSLMYQRPIHTFLVARIVTSDLQLCQSFCSKTFSLSSLFFFFFLSFPPLPLRPPRPLPLVLLFSPSRRYTCTATHRGNASTFTSAEVLVHVMYKPSILTEPADYTRPVKESTHFFCWFLLLPHGIGCVKRESEREGGENALLRSAYADVQALSMVRHVFGCAFTGFGRDLHSKSWSMGTGIQNRRCNGTRMVPKSRAKLALPLSFRPLMMTTKARTPLCCPIIASCKTQDGAVSGHQQMQCSELTARLQ